MTESWEVSGTKEECYEFINNIKEVPNIVTFNFVRINEKTFKVIALRLKEV